MGQKQKRIKTDPGQEQENQLDPTRNWTQSLRPRRPSQAGGRKPTPRIKSSSGRGFSARYHRHADAKVVFIGGDASSPVAAARARGLSVFGTPNQLSQPSPGGTRYSPGQRPYRQVAVVKLKSVTSEPRQLVVYQGGEAAPRPDMYVDKTHASLSLSDRSLAKSPSPVADEPMDDLYELTKSLEVEITKDILKCVPKRRTEGKKILGDSARSILIEHNQVRTGVTYEINHILACCNGAEVVLKKDELHRIAVIASAAFNTQRYVTIEAPMVRYIFKNDHGYHYKTSVSLHRGDDGEATHIAGQSMHVSSWSNPERTAVIEVTLDPHAQLPPSKTLEELFKLLYARTFGEPDVGVAKSEREEVAVSKPPAPVMGSQVGLFSEQQESSKPSRAARALRL